MTKTIAVVAQKGGTGKTIVAGNLAASYAARGERVLAVDCDRQADLTFDRGALVGDLTLADVLNLQSLGEPIPDAARVETAVDGLDVIAGGEPLDDIIGALYAAEA